VAAQLEAAGVQESVSASILRQEVPTMTYGRLYSGSAPFEVQQETLERLSYRRPLSPRSVSAFP